MFFLQVEKTSKMEYKHEFCVFPSVVSSFKFLHFKNQQIFSTDYTSLIYWYWLAVFIFFWFCYDNSFITVMT